MYIALGGIWLVLGPLFYLGPKIPNSTIVWWVARLYDIYSPRFIATMLAYRKKSIFVEGQFWRDMGK